VLLDVGSSGLRKAAERLRRSTKEGVPESESLHGSQKRELCRSLFNPKRGNVEFELAKDRQR